MEQTIHRFSNCPACDYPFSNRSLTSEAAERHKEKLLKYDNDNTRRTKVVDDQEDYYSSSHSTWLTEDERNDKADADEQQRDAVKGRAKAVLDLGRIL